MTRRSRTAVALVLLVGAFYALTLVSCARGLTQPTGGFTIMDTGAPGIVLVAPLTEEALRYTDRHHLPPFLVAVNGKRVTELAGEQGFIGARAAALVDTRPGARNRFLLRYRDGREVEAELTAKQPSLNAVISGMRVGLLFAISGLLHLLVGLWVWWRRPRDRAAQPLLLTTLAAGLNMAFVLQHDTASRIIALIPVSVAPLWGVAGLNFALAFTGAVTRLRWLVRAGLAIGGGLSIIALITTYFSARGATTFVGLFGAVRMSIGILLALSVVAMGVVCWRYSRPPHPRALRRRARMLGIAAVVSYLVPSLHLIAQPLLNVDAARTWWVAVDLLLLSSFPVLVGYAIVRHQMFDLRVVLRRGAVYAGLSLLVSLISIALVIVVLGKIVRPVRESLSPTVIGLWIAGVVIVVGVLQVRVQRWVDRRVNRSRYVYGRAVADASAALAQTRSLDAIGGTVRAALVDAMQLSRAYFAVWADRGRKRLRCIALGGLGDQRAPLPARLEVGEFAPIARAVQSRALVSTHDSDAVAAQSLTRIPVAGDGHGEAGFWGYYGIEAIVPLTFGPEAEVVGLLLIGPRADDRPLDSEDHGLLATLANQLATAVQNAEAFEEIRRLNEGLEQQVAERTQELSQALESLKGTQGRLVEAEKQATIGRLAAGIVHEINTPLGTLRSSVDTLDRALRRCRPLVASGAGAGDGGRAFAVGIESASVLRTSSERLQKVVESLKRFVSVEESEERALNVRESIEDAVALLGPTLGERIEIVRDYPEQVPLVRCNPARLNQVFVNLLENAAQAIDQRGKIRIAVIAHDGRLEISFIDDGHGIPAAQQQRLFAFDLTTKRDGRVGLRLGLPSSKRTVEEIGGTLEVHSVEGQGTTVRLTLPTILPS